MFTLRIKETMKQMGIKPTLSKLIFLGCRNTTAHNLMNGKAKVVKLKTLFELCIYLNCTPNDLLDIADKDMNLIPKGHPLLSLKKPDYIHSPITTLRDLPYDKIQRANELLKQLKEE